jgi:hypothetical protein
MDKGTGLTHTWDDSQYKEYRAKWANKGEYEVVSEIRERFRAMSEARRASCPWASPFEDLVKTDSDSENSDGGVWTGTNWSDRWNLDDQLYMMHHEYEQNRSNLKSPTSFAPIQAALAEFQSNDVDVLFGATRLEDEGKIKLNKYIHEDWENRYNVQQQKKTTFFETITRGTSLPYNGWLLKSREVDIIQSSAKTRKEVKKMVDERNAEIQAAKDTIMKDMKPLVKRETLVEYNDCIYVPTSLFEIFVDPDARVLRGPAYEAADIAWRQLPSLEQFRSEFLNSSDPYVKKENVKKVRSAMQAQDDYGDMNPFFKSPQDITGTKVELIRYYNKQTDKYIILANDVLVREGPLPYNHKELPFSRHICFELKDQFYGAGLPVMLESLQSEDETLRNMALDHMKLKLNPPLLINTDIFNDIDQGWEFIEPGLKVEVGGKLGPENIQWFDAPGVGFDFYKMREGLRDDAVVTSGINPTAYSMPRPNEPVRTHILSMESTLKMVKKMMQNWGEGWINSVRQFVKVRQQMLPESFIEEAASDGGKTRKYPVIKTKGVQLEAIWQEQGVGNPTNKRSMGIQENNIGDDNGYFDLSTLMNENGEYLDLLGDIDVQIDLDSMVPRSHGLKVEQIDKAMAVLVPLLTNPMALQAPGVNQLIREYIKINGIDQRIGEELQEESTEVQEQWADDQEQQMMNGVRVQGVPGESAVHKMHHMRILMALTTKKEEIEGSFGGQTDQLGNPMEPSPQSQHALAQIAETIALLSEHLAVDDTDKPKAVGLTMQAAQQATNPQPQGSDPSMNVGGLPPMGGMGPGGAPAGQPLMGGMPGMTPQGPGAMPPGMPQPPMGGMPGGPMPM